MLASMKSERPGCERRRIRESKVQPKCEELQKEREISSEVSSLRQFSPANCSSELFVRELPEECEKRMRISDFHFSFLEPEPKKALYSYIIFII
jgi:hypothetical protein